MRKSLKVLLVEDDIIEVMNLKRVLENLKFDHKITQFEDGEEALLHLNTTNIFPDLILLDLNMARMNGIEFLKHVKSHKDLKHIPTVILTTSSNKKDVFECYQIGIAGYVLKPLKYEDYVDYIQSLFMYWSSNELI